MEIKNKIHGGDEEEIKNKRNKKRSRSMHVIGVVLFMLRRRRRTKPFNNGLWRRVVESFRLLKNDNITILPLSSPVVAKEETPASSVDHFSEMVEVLTVTPSSSSTGISGYGSAKSLHDIDCLDGDDCDCYDDDDGGDEMIDVKAEEFIVRFYEQMRMQNQAYSDRYNAKEMITV